ncbi:MAG TPA: enolase C-terminal domain-like protein, partial [Patescibacteria group bacterium]|nr:enolase C-terminal domain-like protein [Patescibacteria group bacterium]
GGLHGTGNLDIQEFMVVPARRLSYTDSLKMGDELYLNLKEILTKKSLFTSVGDEGGFTPTLYTNASALDLLLESARAASYRVGQDVFISLDVAANQLKHGDKYFLKDSSDPFSAEGMLSFYQNLVGRYNILSLEDPFSEDDWPSWRKLRELIGGSTLVVGDDLTVTNPSRVRQAIAERAISAVIVKPNQIGTVTEALQVVSIAKDNQITTIVSHRSGDTDDSFIADFAAGVGADYFKGGAPARGERVAKYNRFLEIEAQLAAKTT